VIRTALPRLKAAFLAALFLSGGGSLPVLDLIVKHHGRTEVARPHYEAANTPHSHGDVCTLGTALPFAPQAAPLDVGPPVGIMDRPPAVAPVATAPRPVEPSLLPQPRAPPGLLA
jgi:hypothetical protein